MTVYSWEPLDEGEVPEWGDVLRIEKWPSSFENVVFVGADPVNEGRYICTREEPAREPSGGWLFAGTYRWLRRVEHPHRWERWIGFTPHDGLYSLYPSEDVARMDAAHRSVLLLHIWCTADGELCHERVKVDQ